MYKSIVSTVFFLLCFIGVLILIFFYNKHDISKLPMDYAIVFDAGSSGTRMYVFKWKAGFSAARGDPLVVTEALSCKTGDNGIDKTKNEADIKKYFSSCIREANQKVPDDRKNRTYIFLAATAGMRLLEARNKTASDEIFRYIREYFKSLNFLFLNNTQARIISGQEEGADAWISANYFENNFVKKPTSDDGLPETKGILDLGGASTQIVFVPKNPNPNYKNFFSNIRILGKTYKPYSYSFLCWGLKEITQLYQTYLITKNNYQNKLSAACFPLNSKTELTGTQIFESPCANGLLFNQTFNVTVNASKIDKNVVFNFVGKSDPKMCQEEIEKLMPKVKCSYASNECSFNDIYQPPIEDVKFLGFSSFYFSRSNTEKLLADSYENDLEKFKNATEHICSRTYAELVELNRTNNAGLNEGFLKDLCFADIYSTALTSRYGFTDYKNLLVTNKINNYSLSWTLGYLINELNREDFLPSEKPPRFIEFPLFLTLVLLLGFIGCNFLIYVMHKTIKLDYKRTNTTEEAIPISIKGNPKDDHLEI